jgi:hypothetical protein
VSGRRIDVLCDIVHAPTVASVSCNFYYEFVVNVLRLSREQKCSYLSAVCVGARLTSICGSVVDIAGVITAQ